MEVHQLENNSPPILRWLLGGAFFTYFRNVHPRKIGEDDPNLTSIFFSNVWVNIHQLIVPNFGWLKFPIEEQVVFGVKILCLSMVFWLLGFWLRSCGMKVISHRFPHTLGSTPHPGCWLYICRHSGIPSEIFIWHYYIQPIYNNNNDKTIMINQNTKNKYI